MRSIVIESSQTQSGKAQSGKTQSGKTQSGKTQSGNYASQSLTVATLLCVLLFSGCNDRAVEVRPEAGGILPPANPQPIKVEKKQPQDASTGEKAWLDTKSLPTTSWYSQFLNGKCIGFSEFTINSSETQGTNLLSLVKRDVLEIAATATTPVQRREIVLESLEDLDGHFRSYTETSTIGVSVSKSAADLLADTLTTTKTVDGKPSPTVSIAWKAGTWGPLGTIAILRQQPMKPDEFREASVFVPPLNKIVRVEFKSKNTELTTLPGGVVTELLLVETLFVTDEGSSLTKNWVDKENGEIIKSVSPGGFTMFRITHDEAKRIDDSMLVAQLIRTTIPIDTSAAQIEKQRATFLIDTQKVDPFGLLSSKVNQQVKSLSALGAEVTVHRALETDAIPDGVQMDQPDASHRQKFTEGTPQVQAFLRELQIDATDPLDIAKKLIASLFHQVKKVEFSRTPTSILNTLLKKEGDCNAHAMLLVAVLRERGIPARAASGLRLVRNKSNGEIIAIYHMWCEAWIRDRWLPLDPFIGSVGVGVDHIKFFESSLNEENPLNVMLKVLEPMNQLTIAVKP